MGFLERVARAYADIQSEADKAELLHQLSYWHLELMIWGW